MTRNNAIHALFNELQVQLEQAGMRHFANQVDTWHHEYWSFEDSVMMEDSSSFKDALEAPYQPVGEHFKRMDFA